MLPMSVSGVQWQDYNIRRQTPSERPVRGQLYPRETNNSAWVISRTRFAIAFDAPALASFLTRDLWRVCPAGRSQHVPDWRPAFWIGDLICSVSDKQRRTAVGELHVSAALGQP